MSTASRIRCFLYGVIALVALCVCWSQNIFYLQFGGLDGLLRFMGDSVVTPAATSLTFDLLFFTLVAIIWMVHESRRLGIRYVWVYVVFAFVIAISVTFPLFLIAREKKLQESGITTL